jgi:signal transduction histidine kinase/CheY-like chemotaxis protein
MTRPRTRSTGAKRTRPIVNWFSADLVEILPAAVYVCDAAAVVVSYNKRAAELWGRAPKLGDTDLKFCGSHKLFRPDGTFLPHHETPMELVLRTGQPARDQEAIIEQPDGSRLTVLVNIAPLFDERGTLIGAVNCFQDLSARRQSEKEQLQLREDLHQAQKIQALGELTGGIAHDFNNLLGEITGSLDLMQRRIDTGRTDGIDGFITSAKNSADRAGMLTHRLLAFARQQSLDIRSLDINDLVVGMGDIFRRTLGENISFDMMLKGDLWPALTDANQLDSVLLNLVVNARDAMPHGGRLTLETTNMRIDEAHTGLHDDIEAGDYVMIGVSDTGCGMPASVIAKAFDPFFTTKPIGQGTGLGLSMTHGFAKQSGGYVRIYSEVGQGTSVKLYLRRGMRDAEQPGKIVKPPAPQGQGEAILIVDDNETLRSVMVQTVTELGYCGLDAPDAKGAIAILQSKQKIKLLVTDVGLPNMNGRQLAEIAHKLRPDLKVLFVTGYAQNAAVRGEFLGPGMEMLTKPFSLTALSTKIEELLTR